MTAETPTALLAAGYRKAPEGHVIVPIQPTDEMRDAGESEHSAYDIWEAMIAAAIRAGKP